MHRPFNTNIDTCADNFNCFSTPAEFKFKGLEVTFFNAVPDYKIFVAGYEMIVEIKQIDMNPEKRQEYDKFRKGRIAALFSTLLLVP